MGNPKIECVSVHVPLSAPGGVIWPLAEKQVAWANCTSWPCEWTCLAGYVQMHLILDPKPSISPMPNSCLAHICLDPPATHPSAWISAGIVMQGTCVWNSYVNWYLTLAVLKTKPLLDSSPSSLMWTLQHDQELMIRIQLQVFADNYIHTDGSRAQIATKANFALYFFSCGRKMAVF